MAILSRLFRSGGLAAIALATGLGLAALTPAPARAQSDDDLVRVIVDVADVVFRNDYPYYRYGDYGYDDRLTVVRDRYGRPVYYRDVPRYAYYNSRPPYGKAHGYWKKHRSTPRVSCDRYGRCISRYYEPNYDRRYNRYYGNYGSRYDDRYYGSRHYGSRYYRDGRYWDGYRYRDRDHDDDD